MVGRLMLVAALVVPLLLFAAPCHAYDQVVLHAATARERRVAQETIRQIRVACAVDPERCPHVTLWIPAEDAEAYDRPADVNALKTYRTAAPLSRVLEGLEVMLERGAGRASSALSLDMAKWSPCAKFGSWLLVTPPLRALPDRGLVSVAKLPDDGEPITADLALLILAWSDAQGEAAVGEYVAGFRATVERDAALANWMRSTADDVALEALHRSRGLLDAYPLPKPLRCSVCQSGRLHLCVGADAELGVEVVRALLHRTSTAVASRHKRAPIVANATAMKNLAAAVLGPDAKKRLRCLKGAVAAPPNETPRNKPRIVLVSGVNVRPHVQFIDVDLALSKRNYAARHSYAFEFYVAENFARVMLGAFGGTTPPWEFVKIFMLQDAAHKHPDAAWVVWVDADAWINPAFAEWPLDIWLDEPPPEKLVVLANYRGLNTGVVAIRGCPEGRALIAAWSSVAGAGLAQCHPHDQAALQMVQLWYMNGSQPTMRAPYGYDCTKPPHAHTCGGSGSWSCITLWAKAIERAHALESPRFDHRGKWSVGEVIDRGFANAATPVFHVVSENEHRPKLQCFLCLKSLAEATRAPGNNFPRVHPSHREGFLVNHKGQILFYQQAFASKADPSEPCFVDTSIRQLSSLVFKPPS